MLSLFVGVRLMSYRLDILIERARKVMDGSVNEELSSEIFVFDFDKTLQHEYKPLQCAEMMRQHQEAGLPCYIVTARDPNKGQEKHIKDVCKRWGIKINQKDIFCTGLDGPKGPVVKKLIQKHQAEKCTFWDDKEANCESVYESCYDQCEQLQIFWLSAAIPGDIRKEFGSLEDNERYEKKPTLQERRLFRNWRRLSGI
jgi:hypothetical protein